MARLDDIGHLYAWKLDEMEPNYPIVAGTFINDETDVKWQENLHGENVVGKRLRYVAVTGHNRDWAVYIDHERYPDQRVMANGQKLVDMDVLKRLVNFDETALQRYRR